MFGGFLPQTWTWKQTTDERNALLMSEVPAPHRRRLALFVESDLVWAIPVIVNERPRFESASGGNLVRLFLNALSGCATRQKYIEVPQFDPMGNRWDLS